MDGCLALPGFQPRGEPGVARRDSDVLRMRIVPIERLVLLRF